MKRTPKQIAEAEGVSRSTIYALVKQGRLPAYRVGARGAGKILIEEEDWKAFMEACRAEQSFDDGELTYLR